jgi:hypothetical protein
MVRDPSTGKYKRARLFVLTLGYSRKCVRLLTWRSSAQIWAELHEHAFRRLGGTVKTIVLDNLGEGVLTPDIYDPALNPLYRDVLAHYGVVALPCRVFARTRVASDSIGLHAKTNNPMLRASWAGFAARSMTAATEATCEIFGWHLPPGFSHPAAEIEKLLENAG